MKGWPYVFLVAGLSAAIACGGRGGTAAPSTTPGGSNSPPVSPSATGLPPVPTTPSPSGSPGPNPPHVEMKLPVASALGADLQSLGLDPASLPPIEKLDPKALRGVMKLFARSLGGKCGDCHQEGDFAAPTRRKKIATRMWNDFAAKLTTSSGAPVFCDSCHRGRIVQLDRTDKTALGKWMETAFVGGLKQRDGKTEECASCHVDKEMHFLGIWGK